jgi:hypothetical protein
MPRLAVLPIVRFWCESSDILDAKSSLLSTALIDFLNGMTRKEMSEWIDEIAVCKADVLSALDAYAGYLQMLRQDIQSDKLGNSVSQIMRQVGELKALPAVDGTLPLAAMEGKPSVEHVLGMLNTVWQTIEKIEMSSESDKAPNMDMVRELISRTKTCLQNTKAASKAQSFDHSSPASYALTPQPAVSQPRVAPAPVPQEVYAEAAVAETVYEEAPDEQTHIAPENLLSSGNVLWLDCGSDVQMFASAARVLADARIGIEGVERQQEEGSVTVKITLRDESQAAHAQELLSQAGVRVM